MGPMWVLLRRTAWLGPLEPLVEDDEKIGGPLLVPLSPKEKDSDDDSEVRIMSYVSEAPRGHNPTAFGPDAPKTKASLAPLPLARLAHRSTSTSPSNPLPPRPRASKKMILLPLRRKTKRKRPTVAAIG
jgi:hypothetical protein